MSRLLIGSQTDARLLGRLQASPLSLTLSASAPCILQCSPGPSWELPSYVSDATDPSWALSTLPCRAYGSSCATHLISEVGSPIFFDRTPVSPLLVMCNDQTTPNSMCEHLLSCHRLSRHKRQTPRHQSLHHRHSTALTTASDSPSTLKYRSGKGETVILHKMAIKVSGGDSADRTEGGIGRLCPSRRLISSLQGKTRHTRATG